MNVKNPPDLEMTGRAERHLTPEPTRGSCLRCVSDSWSCGSSRSSIPRVSVLAVSGCVAGGSYHAVKAEAEPLQAELMQERLKVRAIESMYT